MTAPREFDAHQIVTFWCGCVGAIVGDTYRNAEGSYEAPALIFHNCDGGEPDLVLRTITAPRDRDLLRASPSTAEDRPAARVAAARSLIRDGFRFRELRRTLGLHEPDATPTAADVCAVDPSPRCST